MSVSFRRLAPLAAAFVVTAASSTAFAQSVIVRQAPPDRAVELFVNDTRVGEATRDQYGNAIIPFNLQALTKDNEVDANVFVDVCEKRYRVVVAARGMAMPGEEVGCDRRPVSGLFLVKRDSTLVVDVNRPLPTMLLIQGTFDPSPQAQVPQRFETPAGLVIFGAVGRGTYQDVETVACGDIVCEADSGWGALTAGAEFWITPYLAASGSFIKPAKHDMTGTGGTYSFDSFADAYVWTIGGKVGIPLRRFRPYGYFGGGFHRASFSTTQTDQPRTIEVDGVQQTIPGGTQSSGYETEGWRWTYAGGAELWANRRVAVYGEFSRTKLDADALEGSARIDDNLTMIVFGLKIRIGG